MSKRFCVQYADGIMGSKYHYSPDFETFTEAYNFMLNLDPKWRYKNVQDYSEDGKTRFYINPDYYQEYFEMEKKQWKKNQ